MKWPRVHLTKKVVNIFQFYWQHLKYINMCWDFFFLVFRTCHIDHKLALPAVINMGVENDI